MKHLFAEISVSWQYIIIFSQNYELKCFICNEIITMENIGLIISHHNEIIICCDKSECIFKVKTIMEE